MSPGRRREFHDDITVIVFFFAPAKSAEEPADKVSGWQVGSCFRVYGTQNSPETRDLLDPL